MSAHESDALRPNPLESRSAAGAAVRTQRLTTAARDKRTAAALSSLIARLQVDSLGAADPSEQYNYCVVWSGPDRAFRGSVDELPELCWFADEQTAALAGIRNRAREAVAEAAAAGAPIPRPFSELRASGEAALARASGSGAGVPFWIPIELWAELEAAAREQLIEPRLLAISRLAGSLAISLSERRTSG
ncbi:hypothetical protein [Microterricola viridarii]|uniref:Uncharacterized protein n=1 Tax=Microterricola viridarii TaxID=412690 RepID=A0A1H1Y1P1_9MICO|nr:hypothetical protein [Microterricola viridarii]SDT15353.1 hypothetical protein SAMN04489834_2950 [Microterricola viridarii]